MSALALATLLLAQQGNAPPGNSLDKGYPPLGSVAFVRDDNLYVLPADRTGHLRTDNSSYLVASLGQLKSGDSVSFGWTPARKIAIEYHLNGGNFLPDQVADYALSEDIWLADPRPGGKLTHLCLGDAPSFSPDGRFVAFTRHKDTRTDVVLATAYIRDLGTGQERLIGNDCSSVVWNSKGDEIALVAGKYTGIERVQVLAFPSLQLLNDTEPKANPTDLSFSPDGRRLAVYYGAGVSYRSEDEQSLVGHMILDLTNSEVAARLRLPSDPKYGPPLLTDWSPTSRNFILNWRTFWDAKNHGYAPDKVVVSAWPKGKPRVLGEGQQGRFAANGLFVLWLSPDGNLVQAKATDGNKLRLQRKVEAFDVLRTCSGSSGLRAQVIAPWPSI